MAENRAQIQRTYRQLFKVSYLSATGCQRCRGQRVFVDLSHIVENGMITYKGLPAPIICDYLTRDASKAHYSEGTTFQIGKIEMVANTGTYLDSPFHRYARGKDLAELPLTSLANLPG